MHHETTARIIHYSRRWVLVPLCASGLSCAKTIQVSLRGEQRGIPYKGKFWQNSQNTLLVNLIFGDLYAQRIAHVHWTRIWRFLIWRLTLQSPNCQIKTTAKISRHTVFVLPLGRWLHTLDVLTRQAQSMYSGSTLQNLCKVCFTSPPHCFLNESCQPSHKIHIKPHNLYMQVVKQHTCITSYVQDSLQWQMSKTDLHSQDYQQLLVLRPQTTLHPPMHQKLRSAQAPVQCP